MPGPIETRVARLASEIFEPADLAASLSTPTLVARSASFIVLAHAEIEWAIERACLQTANLLKTAREPLTALMMWGFISVKENRRVNLHKKILPQNELVEIYSNVVETNHGIKEYNLRSLLVPIGVDVMASSTDIQALNSFGESRGYLAHKPLSEWQTKDLPSAHVTGATQAAYAADQIVNAIIAQHSLIDVRNLREPLVRRVRRTTARALRGLANRIS